MHIKIAKPWEIPEAPGQKKSRWYPWPYFEGLTMREEP